MTYIEKQPTPIVYKKHLFVFLDRFWCWCVLTDSGDKTKEPMWATLDECRRYVDSLKGED